jgi:MFS family permease
MADHFGRRAYGAITALQGILVALCAGLGPLAAGWLYDVLHHYDLAFWLCAGAFLLATASLALAPQPNEWHDGATQAHSMRGEDMVESGG